MELPASEARSRISELLDAVAAGEFIYLTRRGKRVAALMPADIAENYEKIEDEYWARRAEEARARLASGEDEVISFEPAGRRGGGRARSGMTYRVEISRRAAKAVTGLDKPVRRKVLAAIGALAGDPRPVGCKKLAGQET